jgi:predicted TIM-barrel fold metal-dependent hydrolase
VKTAIREGEGGGRRRRPAAQELNLPLSLHVITGRKGGVDFFKGNLALQGATLHHEIERSLAVLVLGGVLERFPNLKIVSAENDVAWRPTSYGGSMPATSGPAPCHRCR